MSFASLIKQEQEKLEKQSGGGNSVEYPKTKHKRLFFEKGQKEVLLQVLPSADLVSSFVEPTRKIFINARSSQGKEMNINFTLDSEVNQGSLLENKITEWGEKSMMPTPFGGQQTPRRLFLMNVISVVQDQAGNYVQERDEHGHLVVRVFELPQSGYTNLIKKLQDSLLNPNPSSDLSFINPTNPLLIKISKPGKGQMEYPVDVYTNITLPPLEQGWENQLEDLTAQGVPTERLVGGADWVQAFVDMKEGRKPNQTDNTASQDQQAPTQNPYAPQGQAPQYPPQNQQAPQYPPQNQQAPQAPPVQQYQQPQAPPVQNQGAGQAPTQNPVAPPVAPPVQQAPPQAPPVAPPVQQAPPVAPPVQQTQVGTPPATNGNNLNDIDALLEAELNG